ncbi:hypothetical protein NC651_016260 [Populus alba x Populus x berolinensis]|nr:hypothetical protein NC651_016260 [Populus alba x Populus x berolinensis]
MWLSIKNKPYRPIEIENGVVISKTKSEYMDDDKTLFSIDVKTTNTLYCAFKYKITHEGINQVKESKIKMLVHQYEFFQILLNMFTRMTIITKSLHALS